VQPSQVCGGAQFERSGFLASRYRQRLFKQFLRSSHHTGAAFEDKCTRIEPEELRFKKTFAGPVSGCQTLHDDFSGRRQLMSCQQRLRQQGVKRRDGVQIAGADGLSQLAVDRCQRIRRRVELVRANPPNGARQAAPEAEAVLFR